MVFDNDVLSRQIVNGNSKILYIVIIRIVSTYSFASAFRSKFITVSSFAVSSRSASFKFRGKFFDHVLIMSR